MSTKPTSSSRAPDLSCQHRYLPVRAAPEASFCTRLAPDPTRNAHTAVDLVGMRIHEAGCGWDTVVAGSQLGYPTNPGHLRNPPLWDFCFFPLLCGM